MPSWKKGAKEFTVSVSYHEKRGAQCPIPKPLYEEWGRPEKIRFRKKGNKVEVSP
ncbi:MAG: hypothetical protein QXU32_10840 [Nitrososphaerales archaeon]